MTIDGASRKYVAYDCNPLGSRVYLFYCDDPTGQWTPYSGNPILDPGDQENRWPSTVWDGSTLHMFFGDLVNGKLERWTSNDGINFSHAEDVIATESEFISPFVWQNPNDSKWYLYWHDHTVDYVYTRSANAIADLGAASDVFVGDDPKMLAGPTVTYINGLYWLFAEWSDGPWHITAFFSRDPEGPFIEATNSPVLGDGYYDQQACPIVVWGPSDTVLYLYTTHKQIDPTTAWLQRTNIVEV